MPYINELAARLVSQGVGVLSSNILLGPKADIPAGDGPYIMLSETGGTGSLITHDDYKTERPTAQVAVIARKYDIAHAKAKEAFDALDGVFNVTLLGVKYQSIKANQPPAGLGLDAKGRPMVVFNVSSEKEPS